MLPANVLRALGTFLVPCARVCAIMISGANADAARFRRDLARAQAIWRQCGVNLQEGTVTTVNDMTLLDLADWDCTGMQPASARRLTGMRGSCAANEIVVFYIRSMGTGLAGCGGSAQANGSPGITMTDFASQNTFPHELGHILVGSEHANDATFATANPGVDAKTNVMYTPSGNITVNPPRITAGQCSTARASGAIQQCQISMLVEPEMIPMAVAAGAAPGMTVRDLLMTDEEDGLLQVVSMGQAVVPMLMMLLSDPNPQVRSRANAALGRIAGPAALPLLQRTGLQDPNPVVRLVTANTLARFAGAAAEPALMSLLMDPDIGVRITALRSLATLPSTTARMALAQTALRETNPQVQALAGMLAQGMQM